MFELIHNDCRAALDFFIADNSVDSIVTDPPYELGFMGKGWDRSGVAFDPETWRAALRVLKPGGHLIAFGGTRTYHRLVCAIEDAGFEVRNMLAWLYGQGFPKATDKAKIPEAWEGWNTALKPGIEPICLARKPMEGTLAENLAKWGTGAMWIDGCRVDGEPWKAHSATGLGSVKFFTEGNAPVIDKAPHALGRWPANVLHDGSDEVLAAFPQAKGQQGALTGAEASKKTTNTFGEFAGRAPSEPRGDTGSAARFFYCAKASKSDRGAGNNHPTVKPTDLMRYLCRLVTPSGGTVLDPFMGSGSTGKAAMLEALRFIGIEQSADYVDIARARLRKFCAT